MVAQQKSIFNAICEILWQKGESIFNFCDEQRLYNKTDFFSVTSCVWGEIRVTSLKMLRNMFNVFLHCYLYSAPLKCNRSAHFYQCDPGSSPACCARCRTLVELLADSLLCIDEELFLDPKFPACFRKNKHSKKSQMKKKPFRGSICCNLF